MNGSESAVSGSGGPLGGSYLLSRMVADGRLEAFEAERVKQYAARIQDRVEEAILECGLMVEADLLRYLASIYQTQFVSTAKLSKAQVQPELLDLVPVKIAERLDVFPVLYDRKTQTLSVIAADLEGLDVAKQVQLVSGARQVRTYVARPKAIRAAIQKHYHRRPQFFSALLVEEAGGAPGAAARPAAGPVMGPSIGLDDFDDLSFGGGGARGPSASTSGEADAIPRPAGFSGLVPDDRPEAAPPRSSPAGYEEGYARSIPTTDADGTPAIAVSFSTSDLMASLSAVTRTAQESTELASDAKSAQAIDEPIRSATYLETLNVLVALLEQRREELRGHSAKVARLCKKLGERIGLAAPQMQGIMVAAYLHDLGKASTYHLTALNVAQYEGHRVQAQKSYLAPLRLFEAANVPEPAALALGHLYERWDGKGFPDHLAGKDIPLGSRILAVVETYVDVTSSPKNPFRQKLSPTQACEALARFKGQFFDPTVVDLLKLVVLGDHLKEKLLEDRRTVLLVDPDPEETTVLEMRLLEQGYEVAIARDAVSGLRKLTESEVDVVISEVELSGEEDGFELLRRVRSGPKPKLPIMFLTRRGDRESVTRGFELGAADYVVKPASAEVVAAKARHILDGAAATKAGPRGVTGTLQEMSLPDVIQILSNGRKSGRLTIEADGKTGEIHFGEGAIFDARFGGVGGEEAFYAMLLLSEGDFVLDPSFRPSRNVIHQATESLLLEGMRRLDEGRR